MKALISVSDKTGLVPFAKTLVECGYDLISTGGTFKLLSENNVGLDCNGYPKAPPSFRIWAGGTVQTSDVELVLPWIDWAYTEIKSKHA